jgi:hypothetical protein
MTDDYELWKNAPFQFVTGGGLTALWWGHGKRSNIKVIEFLGSNTMDFVTSKTLAVMVKQGNREAIPDRRWT